jgi:hypothetical protein
MKTKTILFVSKGFIIFSALSILSVSLMAFHDPQAVMNLVQVQLTNTDAYSSIRGVYGGAGLTICISLLYLIKKNVPLGLLFLSMLWGCYALSRIITILTEGTLGAFGTQWLLIESVLFITACSLYQLNRSINRQ